MERLKTGDLESEQEEKLSITTSLFGLDWAAPGKEGWREKWIRGERWNFNDPSGEIGSLQQHREGEGYRLEQNKHKLLQIIQVIKTR